MALQRWAGNIILRPGCGFRRKVATKPVSAEHAPLSAKAGDHSMAGDVFSPPNNAAQSNRNPA